MDASRSSLTPRAAGPRRRQGHGGRRGHGGGAATEGGAARGRRDHGGAARRGSPRGHGGRLGGAAFDALRRARGAARQGVGRRRAPDRRGRREGERPRQRSPAAVGWQVPRTDDASSSTRELELLVQVLRSLRDLIPPELQQKLAEALRELLLAIRALIDWYLERVEQRRAAPAEVEDIPIL